LRPKGLNRVLKPDHRKSKEVLGSYITCSRKFLELYE